MEADERFDPHPWDYREPWWGEEKLQAEAEYHEEDLLMAALEGRPWVELMQPGDTYEHPLHDVIAAMC